MTKNELERERERGKGGGCASYVQDVHFFLDCENRRAIVPPQGRDELFKRSLSNGDDRWIGMRPMLWEVDMIVSETMFGELI